MCMEGEEGEAGGGGERERDRERQRQSERIQALTHTLMTISMDNETRSPSGWIISKHLIASVCPLQEESKQRTYQKFSNVGSLVYLYPLYSDFV